MTAMQSVDSTTMNIATIIGTRPHFIKAAPVGSALAAAGIREVLIHTGQHYSDNMDRVFFEELGVKTPDYRFDVNNLSHAPMVGRCIEHVSSALEQERPDWVVVYGDTNTSLAGALAAKILGIPLAHVEAGLRSFDTGMQEEVNRVLIDRTSDLLFCPTAKAVHNLKAEGFPLGTGRIVNCGDVMYDAALHFAPRAHAPAALPGGFSAPFITATVHRAENADDPKRLSSIFAALEQLAARQPVVLPLHPRTAARLKAIGFDFQATPLTIIEPVGYLEMLWLLGNCSLLITDGGGLQKEAYFMKRPCVTLRDTTEWTELIDAGANILAGADKRTILDAAADMAAREVDYSTPLYGKGDASKRIAAELTAAGGHA